MALIEHVINVLLEFGFSKSRAGCGEAMPSTAAIISRRDYTKFGAISTVRKSERRHL